MEAADEEEGEIRLTRVSLSHLLEDTLPCHLSINPVLSLHIYHCIHMDIRGSQ